MTKLKLMQGNWVVIDNIHRPNETGKYAKILQIREDDCSVQMIDDEYGINTFGQFNEFLKPIELTPEILDKCPQFECIGGMYGFNNGSVEFVFNEDHISIIVEGQWLTTEIKHLHTLQQLVSLLANTELIVNL